MTAPTPTDAARRWHAGWAAVRGYDWAAEPDGVVVTHVGDERRETELLVPDVDGPRLDRACQRALAERRTLLTVVTGDTARTGDRIGEHGLRVLAAEECLMHADLAGQPSLPLPEGYAASALDDAGLRLHVTAPDGSRAASGQAGLVDVDCVLDRILTEPDHRRRGLGGAVVSALVGTARDAGAAYGVLVASPEGRLLYERLGWERVADVVMAQQP